MVNPSVFEEPFISMSLIPAEALRNKKTTSKMNPWGSRSVGASGRAAGTALLPGGGAGHTDPSAHQNASEGTTKACAFRFMPILP